MEEYLPLVVCLSDVMPELYLAFHLSETDPALELTLIDPGSGLRENACFRRSTF